MVHSILHLDSCYRRNDTAINVVSRSERHTIYDIRNTSYRTAACAAASLAIGTLNGEHET
jgi:hypothetical protein